MQGREWERLALQHKREFDALFERQFESMQAIMKNQDKLVGDATNVVSGWQPFYLQRDYEPLGAPPEGTYSSKQMDSIRKLQLILHRRYITKKWKNLHNLYSQTPDGVIAVQRWKAVQALILTERKFCSTLQHVNNYYAVPLLQQEAGGSVSLKDLQGIFSNLFLLLKSNQKFLHSLEIQYHRYPLKPMHLGSSFENLATHISEYEKYIDRYTNALSILSQLQKIRPFNDWLENIAPLPGANRSNTPSFAELLIAPVRRIGQYEALYASIAKNTPKEHAEYDDIKSGSEKAAQIAMQTNIVVSQAEGVLQVYDIQSKFTGLVPNLVKPYRRFLRYDCLNEVGEQAEERFVALFNDCIVIASADESSNAIGSYKFLRTIPLHKASAKSIPDLPPSKIRVNETNTNSVLTAFINCIMLGTTSGVVSFSCRTKQVRETWLTELQKVIENLDSNFFSFDATESDDKKKEGFLLVCEKGTNSWANRWCSLEHGALNICNSYQGQSETSIVVKQCRLNLLADKEAGKRYCFELENSFSKMTIRFGLEERDSFDQWVNLLVPMSNQEVPDVSDEDIAQLRGRKLSLSSNSTKEDFLLPPGH